MSDGNFNRNLLPYRDFQSGVRAGRAQMRTAALSGRCYTPLLVVYPLMQNNQWVLDKNH